MQSVVETLIDCSEKIQNQNNTISTQQTTINGLNEQVVADNNNFDAIYDAIVDKGQHPTKADRSTYAPAIEQISGGGGGIYQSKTISPSGSQQTVLPDQGYDALSDVVVNAAPLQNKTVSPSTSQQSVQADSGNYGLGTVTVEAAPLQNKTVSPSTSQQSVQADSPNYGLGTVTVEAVDASIDNNIQAGNIKSGVSILGVQGNYSPAAPSLQNKTVTPSASQQTVQADSGYDGLDTVTVEGDADLVSSNIKAGVNIFGVNGNYDPQPTLQTKSVTPSTSAQVITPDNGYDGLGEVDVSAVTSAIDNNIQSNNIKNGVSILGVTGSYNGKVSGIGTLFKESKEYSDASPVTYEWTIDNKVDVVNITNNDEGGGTWNIATAAKLAVSVKRSSSGSYETLVEGTGYTLTTTGSSSGNYFYNIEIEINDYVYAVKVVYTDLYRVRGRLECNIIHDTYYAIDTEPSSTVGYNNGDFWIVTDQLGRPYKNYKFNGTAWVELNKNNIILSKSIKAATEPANVFEAFLDCYNTYIAIYTPTAKYIYDRTNNTWTTVSNTYIASDYRACYKTVRSMNYLFNAYSDISGKFYLKRISDQVNSTSTSALNVDMKVNGDSSISGNFTCIAYDGTYIYVVDKQNSKIWKVRDNMTGGVVSEFCTITRIYTQLIYANGALYGVCGDYVDKINKSTGAITNILHTSENAVENYYRSIVSYGSKLYLVGGYNNEHTIIEFNDSGILNTYTIEESFRQSSLVIGYKDGIGEATNYNLMALNYNEFNRSDHYLHVIGINMATR